VEVIIMLLWVGHQSRAQSMSGLKLTLVRTTVNFCMYITFFQGKLSKEVIHCGKENQNTGSSP